MIFLEENGVEEDHKEVELYVEQKSSSESLILLIANNLEFIVGIWKKHKTESESVCVVGFFFFELIVNISENGNKKVEKNDS